MTMKSHSEAGSFEGWYAQAYQPSIRAVLFVCSGNVQRAEDVISEAFSRALEQWDSVSKMDSPEGWLIRVAINLEKRRLGRRRKESQLIPVLRDDGHPTEEAVGSDEIWTIVDSLPTRQRHAIARRYIDDWSQAQIAEEMGVAPGTTAATLSQARSSIRDALTGRE